MAKNTRRNRSSTAIENQSVHSSDITTRSLQELILISERYRLMEEATHDAFYDWKISKGEIDWSKNVGAIFRYALEPSSKYFNWWVEKLHPEDRDTILQSLFQGFKAGRNTWMQEYRFLRGDGTYCYVMDRGVITYDQEGLASRMFGVMTDITERKLAERALRMTEERNRQIIDIITEGIWSLDENNIITYVNQGMQRILGYPPEEMIGHQAIDFVLCKNEMREQLQKRREGIHSHYDIRLKHKDGHIIWGMMAGHPIFDETGKFKGTSGILTDITERKKAENALKETEARKAAILESSLDAIVTIDQHSAVVEWNSAAERIFGYPRTAAIGKNVAELIIPKRYREKHYKGIEHYLATGEGPLIDRLVEVEALRADGTEFTAELTITRIPMPGPPLFTGTLRDITERKKAEIALKESEALFRNIADTVPAIIWMVAPDNAIEFENQYFLNFTGLPRKGRWGVKSDADNWAEMFHPDDCRRLYPIYTADFEKQVPFTYEIRLRHHSGQYHWTLMSGRPRYDNLGRFAGYIGTETDIHELKQLESALRESEARFRGMAENAPFMIFLTDQETGYFYFNKAWREFTGTESDKVQNGLQWFLDQVHPEDRSYCLDNYNASLQTKETGGFEFRLRRKDNHYCSMLGDIAPRYGENNKLLGFTCSCIDITDMKSYREQLEQVVADRTSELKMVNHELESFSYSVSHDLRAPLRGIDGISQAIYQDYYDLLDDTGKHYLQILRKEAQRMSELINEMLNLTRLTRKPLHWETVDLSQLTEEIAGALREQEPDRHVTFQIQPGITAKGDTHLLRAVLENILDNSWKFTSKHPTALIEFGTMKQDGQTVYFVKDDGAGFETEYADKLFGPFNRFHDESEFSGTGIGLATVERIIHRHGGKAWGTGAVEQGAQIFFTLGNGHD